MFGALGDYGDLVRRHVVLAPKLVGDQNMDHFAGEVSVQNLLLSSQNHATHNAVQVRKKLNGLSIEYKWWTHFQCHAL